MPRTNLLRNKIKPMIKIKQQLLKLSREDLLELQKTIDDLLPTAPSVPVVYKTPDDETQDLPEILVVTL